MSPKKAVALKYDRDKYAAPRVVGKGMNLWAERILQIAEENGIPVTKNEGLVDLLFRIEVGDEIPSALYLAVAEILAWAYQQKGPKN